MNLDAKSAAIIAKKYFDETKTHPYFLFETISTSYKDGVWLVQCEIKNVFENITKKYEVKIDDDKSIILDVKRSGMKSSMKGKMAGTKFSDEDMS